MYIRGLAVGTLALCVALAVSLLGGSVADAQVEEGDYVDVGLILEVPEHSALSRNSHDLNISVVNYGSRAAYDIEVVLKIEYPKDLSHFDKAPAVPVGNASLGSDERTLRWSIPALGGLQREEVTAKVSYRNASSLPGTGPLFEYANYSHEHFGRVSTSSFESDLHKGNNTDRVWSYRTSTAQHIFYQVAGNYSVAVSVDNPSPSPGETVEFTVKTDREDPYPTVAGVTPPPIDLKVDIELTDGLTVEEKPSATPPKLITYSPTTVDSLSYSNGVFNVGTLKTGDGWTNSVTLPITVADDAGGTKQCLTATLTGNPPPGVGPYDDDISDNVARV